MFFDRLKLWSACAVVATAVACGGAEPMEEAPAEPMAEAEDAAPEATPAGDGTLLRLDDRFDALVPGGAVIEKVADGYAFTEGPVWVRRGDPDPYLLFSDIPNNAVRRWSPTEGQSDHIIPVFEDEYPEGRSVGSNGLLIDSEGRLILAEHGNRRLSRREADGSITVLADSYNGMRLNSPNDGVFHSSGAIYFTDPPYGLLQQDDDPDKELDFNGIFRLLPDGTVQHLAEQSRPNGIALAPDEGTLYVANSDGADMVWYAYDVAEDGTLGPGRVFVDANDWDAPGAADGMAIDRNGNLFATGPGGVWVIAPDGTHLGSIQPDEPPANAGWGDDGNTLYMTGRTGLYRITLSTGGTIP